MDKLTEIWSSPKANSHWRSVWGDEKWLKYGQTHLEIFDSYWNGTRKDTMVEWGVGGGTNAYAFASVFEAIYAVDISEYALKEAMIQVPSIIPVLIDRSDPKLVPIPHGTVDFFLACAVFHHFEDRTYGYRVVQLAHDLLRDRGMAYIQIKPRVQDRFNNIGYDPGEFEANLEGFTIKNSEPDGVYRGYFVEKG